MKRSRSRKRRRGMPAALKRYWASKRGKGRGMAKRKRRRVHTNRRHRVRAHTARKRGGRRVRVRAHLSNPRRHRVHRRRYRRNPRFGGGFVKTATEAVKCGTFVVIGEGVTKTVTGFLPVIPKTGLLGALSQIVVGTTLAVFGRGMLGSQNAAYFAAGAAAGAIRQVVVSYNIPVLAPALSGYTPVAAISAGKLSGYLPRAGNVPARMGAGYDGAGMLF